MTGKPRINHTCLQLSVTYTKQNSCSKHILTSLPQRVLDHFDWEINHVRGGIQVADGSRVPAKIMLLAGADLIQTISTPGVWDAQDVDHILSNFGVFVVERTGTDLETALAQLKRWERNIHVIRQVSSS